VALPPFKKLYTSSQDFSRAQDNVAEPLRVLLTKQLLVTGETAQFLTATVTVPTDLSDIPWNTGGNWRDYFDVDATFRKSFSRKGPDGMVQFYILANRSAGADATMATLASGNRPSLRIGFIANTDTGIGRVDILANGTMTLVGGGSGTVFVCGLFPASDRTPVPLSCWPIQIPCSLKARPNGVFLAEARETATNAYVAASNPDWEWETIAGQNFVIIRNVPFLPPGVEYDLTFAVLGEQ
jgi:hypothetical protein